MEAETPQMETPVAITLEKRWLIASRLDSQYVKNQTAATTTMAWIIPTAPALMTTTKLIPAPMTTKPILMKNSVMVAGFSQAGTPKALLMKRPMKSAQRTYSKP